jgi:hypothetical protein
MILKRIIVESNKSILIRQIQNIIGICIVSGAMVIT